MTATKYAIPFLALVLLIPPGVGSSFAQEVPGDEITEPEIVYELGDIYHAFDVMEEFVIYDENKIITFNLTAAREDSNVSELDISIALDYAAVSNDLMSVRINATGPVGTVNELDPETEIGEILDGFEEGRFRELFGDNDGTVGAVSEVTPVTFDFDAPITFAFGIPKHKVVQIDRPWYVSEGAVACGGGYEQVHNKMMPYILQPLTSRSVSTIHAELRSDGYHNVAWYANGFSSDPLRDWAKVVTTGAPGDCNGGEFRDHGIVQYAGYRGIELQGDSENQVVIQPGYSGYTIQENDPNPELHGYIWPAYWWGAYVSWWHLS